MAPIGCTGIPTLRQASIKSLMLLWLNFGYAVETGSRLEEYELWRQQINALGFAYGCSFQVSTYFWPSVCVIYQTCVGLRCSKSWVQVNWLCLWCFLPLALHVPCWISLFPSADGSWLLEKIHQRTDVFWSDESLVFTPSSNLQKISLQACETTLGLDDTNAGYAALGEMKAFSAQNQTDGWLKTQVSHIRRRRDVRIAAHRW